MARTVPIMRSHGDGAMQPQGRASKGSKQKIFLLKQELNSKKDKTEESLEEKLRLLQEGYDLCRIRAEKALSLNDNTGSHFKINGQKVTKIYAAVSALIYASISVSKASEVEEYIKKLAAETPSTLFDYEDWRGIIDLARSCRSDPSAVPSSPAAQTIERLNLCQFLATNSVQTMQSEVRLLRTIVSSDLVLMQNDLSSARNLILFLMAKLQTASVSTSGGYVEASPSGPNTSPGSPKALTNGDYEQKLAELRRTHAKELAAQAAASASALTEKENVFIEKLKTEADNYQKLKDRLVAAEEHIRSLN